MGRGLGEIMVRLPLLASKLLVQVFIPIFLEWLPAELTSTRHDPDQIGENI